MTDPKLLIRVALLLLFAGSWSLILLSMLVFLLTGFFPLLARLSDAARP